MKKFLILIFVVSACSVNSSKKVDLEELNFNYSDDAYIFFRNMRQTNYDLEVMEEGGWRIYRHDDRQTDTSGFYLNVALVVNWRVNRVYPVIEMSKDLSKDGFIVKWQSIDNNKSDTIILKGEKRRNEMKFLTQLYNKSTEDVNMYVQYEGEDIPLFTDPDHQEAFRVSMYDFYRMTGIL